MILHLLGFPGTGKSTVARAMCAHAEAEGRRLVVVDNHLTSNPVLSIIDADGVRDLPDGVWDRVRKIREVVYQAIEELSPDDWSFVFTNVVVRSDPHVPALFERLERLAIARSTTYVPVVLHCDTAELRRRVPSPERALRHKWVDPDGVESFVANEELIRPKATVFDVDVTKLTAPESAARILRHGGLLAP